MKLIIHRGTHEIGGSCVEIQGKQTRIIIDIGVPLVSADGSRFDFKEYKALSGPELVSKGILPNIGGLYGWESDSQHPDGILISHPHLDHYGYINHVHGDITCHMGEGTKRLIDLNNIFLGTNCNIQKYLYFKSGESFRIAEFTITPFLMDHSAFDSYAFLIESATKKVLYSGDFRAHGRKSKAFYWFLNQLPTNIDAILLEGSVLGRSHELYMTENDIEGEISDAIDSSDGIVFCLLSGQNIDRIVSLYKAVRSKRILVLDVYTANILYALKDLGKIPYPSENFENIKVFFPKKQCDKLWRQGNGDLIYKFKKFKISKAEIAENINDIVMIMRSSMIYDLSRIDGIDGATVIYSMWSGYLKEPSMEKLKRFMKDKSMKVIHTHTSGHAWIATLKRFVNRIKPSTVIPIHTFHPEKFNSIFPNVMEICDREEISI